MQPVIGLLPTNFYSGVIEIHTVMIAF